jgi:hypothetical protein
MGERAVQWGIIAAVLAGGAYLVISSADNWADWVVFGVIVITAFGFAVAVAPNLYARRKRTIARTSERTDTGIGGRSE